MTINFKYKQIDRPEPFDGVYVPAIPVRLIGQKDTIEVIGLLDSGADFSLIPRDMAEILGLNLSGKPEKIGGINGDCKAIKTKVQIRIGNQHENYTFPIKVFVIPDIDDEVPMLVGRNGFFKQFKITFNEAMNTISLKRV